MARPGEIGDHLHLRVLGRGAVVGRILERRPLAWHGMPGLAETLLVLLPDGSVVTAQRFGNTRPVFSDPRLTVDPRPPPQSQIRGTP